MPSWYSRCSALPAFLQILPHQMHRPLLTKLDRWTVPYKTFLFIIQKEEQTPSNAAFGRANATRPNSFLHSYTLYTVLLKRLLTIGNATCYGMTGRQKYVLSSTSGSAVVLYQTRRYYRLCKFDRSQINLPNVVDNMSDKTQLNWRMR